LGITLFILKVIYGKFNGFRSLRWDIVNFSWLDMNFVYAFAFIIFNLLDFVDYSCEVSCETKTTSQVFKTRYRKLKSWTVLYALNGILLMISAPLQSAITGMLFVRNAQKPNCLRSSMIYKTILQGVIYVQNATKCLTKKSSNRIQPWCKYAISYTQ
jgi:hypothetical protein